MPHGRLAGRSVLVPRGGEWGEKVARLLGVEGARAVVVPLIRFEPPADVPAVDAALRRLAEGRYGWLTVTSGTTVTALTSRAAGITGGRAVDALPQVLRGARVAAVGPGTAAALERAGVVADLVPTGERSARGLVAEMPAPGAAPPDPAGRVLAPHSDIAEPTLVDGLRGRGWEVDEVVAYRTVAGPAPAAEVGAGLRTGAFHAVLLSSASTVSAMLELVGRPSPATLVCCIGPRTERAAVDAGLTVHVRAPRASAEELVEALAAHGGAPASPDPDLPRPTLQEER